MSNERTRLHGESGGALVLVPLLTAALAAVMMVALGHLGETAVDRTRARTAADAAALAGLEGGADAARRIAAGNGATLVSFHGDSATSQVTVVVAVGDASATARATDAP